MGVKRRHPGCSRDLRWESTASLSPLVASVHNDKSYCAVRTFVPGPLPGPSGSIASNPCNHLLDRPHLPTMQMWKARLQETKSFPDINRLESGGVRFHTENVE